MINFLNYLCDNYFANKLGKQIITDLAVFNIDKKYEVKEHYLKVFIKNRKFENKFYNCIFMIDIEEAFYLLCSCEYRKLIDLILIKVKEVITND